MNNRRHDTYRCTGITLNGYVSPSHLQVRFQTASADIIPLIFTFNDLESLKRFVLTAQRFVATVGPDSAPRAMTDEVLGKNGQIRLASLRDFHVIMTGCKVIVEVEVLLGFLDSAIEVATAVFS